MEKTLWFLFFYTFFLAFPCYKKYNKIMFYTITRDKKGDPL